MFSKKTKTVIKAKAIMLGQMTDVIRMTILLTGTFGLNKIHKARFFKKNFYAGLLI